MKKVLYIGHYREGYTGWSRAAIDKILALDHIGVDVVCRSVKLGYKPVELPKRILELEEKSLNDIDVCIQHVLPHHMVAGPFRNIGIIDVDTDNFTMSGWQNYLNLMDVNVVTCRDQISSCRNSGVKTSIYHCPHTYPDNRYTGERKRIEGLPNEFLFYAIGELSQRKNLPALLRAFHTEFHPSEPVSLVIKVSSGELSRDELLKQITELCSKIKQDLRLWPDNRMYKSEIMIVDSMSEDEILNLHYSCDCLVNPSYGEGWGFAVQDAIGMGKYVIATNQGGPKDMVYHSPIGDLIDGQTMPVSTVKNTFSGLFTGNENWTAIDIPKLKIAMRNAYRNLTRDDRFKNECKDWGEQRMKDYSYYSVGARLEDIIKNG